MILGGDTGFLIGVAQKSERALHYWEPLLAGTHTLILSPPSLCEFLVYEYKRGRGASARAFVQNLGLKRNIAIVPIDDAIALRAAGYRHGSGIPTVDALILATFVSQGCDLALSTDGHFRIAGERGIIPVEMLT